MDLWSLLGLLGVSLIGGMIIGGVALVLGGAGSLRVLAQRLETLEDRQDQAADRLTSEVKKRASAAGVLARQGAQGDRETVEAARQYLRDQADGNTPPASPQGARRPSVITGR